MSRPDIEGIKSRLVVATPDPWGYENIGEKENCYAIGTAWRYDDEDCRQIGGSLQRYVDDEEVLYFEAVCFCEDSSLSAGGTLHANAEFIANAPTDIRDLISYIVELEMQNLKLQAQIDEYSFTPEPEMGPWS